MGEGVANKDAGGAAAAREPSAMDDEPRSVQTLRLIGRGVSGVEYVLVTLFLAALIGVGTYQAVSSYLFQVHEKWPFEMIRYMVFFIAMTGAALAAERQRMITMDFFNRMLSPRGRTAMRVVVAGLVLLVCVLLVKGGLLVRDSIGQREPHELIHPRTGILVLPIGAAVIGFHYLLHALIDIIYLSKGQATPEPKELQVH